ncbi:hypothetical protein [Methylocapsa palsarum]|uniref:Uncharacterized protein n=1 Tax=Methylocapsa palsarum TaxID=1612308 RepID=A0A1I3WZQ9_9HYPH|nr:hypothetical protein [Methylocapsa palsarum]SFK12968.1 hypothetical protein SAMN05444581_102273 [Methylocapsa palsarum]
MTRFGMLIAPDVRRLDRLSPYPLVFPADGPRAAAGAALNVAILEAFALWRIAIDLLGMNAAIGASERGQASRPGQRKGDRTRERAGQGA